MKADKEEMLKEMMTHIKGTTNKGQIMYELSTCICHAVDADLLNLYLVETDGEITKFIPQGEDPTLWDILFQYTYNYLTIF